MRTFLFLRGLAVGAGMLILMSNPEPSFSQNTDALTNQLDRIQRDLQVLSRQVFNKGGIEKSEASSSANRVQPATAGHAYIIRLEDRLSQLEGESRSNTDNLEKISHTLNQISARLDTLANDINFRIQTIENGLDSIRRDPRFLRQGGVQNDPSGVTVSPKLAVVPPAAGVSAGAATGGSTLRGRPGTLGTISQSDLSDLKKRSSKILNSDDKETPLGQNQMAADRPVLPEGGVRDQYKFAFGLVRKTEYEKASKALDEFIRIHPDEPLASNARYWLGRTHYVRKNYRQAAEVFLASYQLEPKGAKAADNLLNLGMSLAGLKKRREACATFTKLEQDFPDASSVIKKKLAQQKNRAECG